MNGEWGIFVPVAAANAAAVAGGDAAAKAAVAKADAAKVAVANADAAKAAVAKADAAKADVAKAAAAAKAGEAAVGEEGETDVAGKFNTAVATPAGNQKTDILFTGNVSSIQDPIPSAGDTNLHPGSRKPRSRSQRHSRQCGDGCQRQSIRQSSHGLPLRRPAIVQDLHQERDGRH